jgi:DNA-binding CsgD family transcriptional regulator
MRAKEIAQQLSVTPDSVNTARYRLRKKLNLKSDEKLDDFLRNL